MSEKSQKIAGVDRSHHKSTTQKAVFAGLHFMIVAFCAWLLLAGGLQQLGQLVGRSWTFADRPRAWLILAAAALYWLRHLNTLFYLLQRKVDWSEPATLIPFMFFVDVGFLLLGGGVFSGRAIALSGLDALFVLLVLLGSFFNSFAELQRKWWKQDPAHKGHCYTGGLFAWSMHINYFGDVVLFAGWGLLTRNYWTLLLALVMALSFVFFHIPGLDSYLAGHYGDEFADYAKKTKKLIPFVY